MNILYVSRYAIYEGVPHAGGNTVLYYMRSLAKNPKNDVRIVSFVTENEHEKVEIYKSDISYYPIEWKRNIWGMIKSVNSKINPLHRHCNMIASYHIDELAEKLEEIKIDFMPDIIIVEWTQLVVAIKKIRKIFPNAKFIASEHDVTFLASKRKCIKEKRLIKRLYKYLIYMNTKKRELEALRRFDHILTHNDKDKQLLVQHGIPERFITPIVAYYHQSKKEYIRANNNIIFYGALSRKENIDTVIWFVENVLPKLNDIDIRFYVIGGGLSDELRKYSSSRVIFTGYVDKIDEMFSSAMCFVAPLVMGAGIKVKVLEAMYTGITVITNDIGIEGIPAIIDKDYYHCESADEYASTIRKLYNCELPMISAKEFVSNSFDINLSFKKYFELMEMIQAE